MQKCNSAIVMLMLMVAFASSDLQPAFGAQWFVDDMVYHLDAPDYAVIGVPQPDVEWRFASSDGIDYDTTGAGVYRNYGSATLSVGLTDANAPSLTEGVLQPGHGGVKLNGTTNYLLVNDVTSFSPGAADFWAGVWIRTTGTAGYGVFGKYSSGSPANKREWVIFLNITANYFKVTLSDDGTANAGHSKQYTNQTVVNDGKWHLLTFTWVSKALTLYMDGSPQVPVKAADDAITSIYNGTSKTLIGCIDSGSPGIFYSGDIAWAVYDTGVSCPNDAQMLALYTAMAPTGAVDKPFPTIQSAAYARAAADTIYVQAGRYQETVVFSKAGALLGYGHNGLDGLYVQVSLPELYGAALPAAAGTVGITATAKQNIGFVAVRGYAAQGILGSATSDGTIIHHCELDSNLYGVDFDGAANNDSLINCVIDAAGLGSSAGWRATTSATATLVVKNNIFVNCTTALTKAASQTLVETNNCFYGNTTNYASTLNSTDLLVNPFLTRGGNDYRPQKFSRVLNAGTVIHSGVSPFNYVQNAPPMGVWDIREFLLHYWVVL